MGMKAMKLTCARCGWTDHKILRRGGAVAGVRCTVCRLVKLLYPRRIVRCPHCSRRGVAVTPQPSVDWWTCSERLAWVCVACQGVILGDEHSRSS